MESRGSANTNNLIQALLTDKYQISMCYAYWRDSKHNDPAVFDMFFRKNPFRGEYTVFAGLDECLKYVKNFKFEDHDINYLKTIPDYVHVEEQFWQYLKGLKPDAIKLYALKEGSACFPSLPLIRAEGPLGLVQLVETTLLNLINYASLIATNAARYKWAANSGNIPGCKLLEFGLRRAQGPDGGFSASRYAYIGGFDATSNLLAGKEFGIPVSGTLGHSLIMAYFGTTLLSRESISEHKFLLNKKTGKEENFTLCCFDVEDDILKKNVLLGKNFDKSSKSHERSELPNYDWWWWWW